jgi:hypothetical protein
MRLALSAQQGFSRSSIASFLSTQFRFHTNTAKLGMIPNHAWVILLRDDGTKSLIRASRNAEVKSNNMRALGDQIVGHPYGSTFEFRDEDDTALPVGPHKTLEQLNEKRAKKRKEPLKYSRLVRVQATWDAFAVLEDEQGPEADESEEIRDNRDYSGDTHNQKADSLSLQKSGVTGGELVRELAKNNVTFNLKSKFSQEKYLTRLQRKHIPRVTVVRATSRTVSEVLFFKHQPTMSNDTLRALRWVDALPQMMAFGNVHATARCLVLDGTSGLLSLAVLERLGDDGRCFFVGTNPREISQGGGRAFINLLNMSRTTLAKRFVVCGSPRLHSDGSVDRSNLETEAEERRPSGGKSKRNEDDDEITAITGEGQEGNQDGPNKRVRPTEGEEEEEEGAAAAPSRYDPAEEALVRKLKQERLLEMVGTLDMLNGGPGADSILIAARQEPWEALQVLLPHLGLGRPFVVHHPCLEPLMVAKAKLVEAKSYLDLAVTESFCREYQVLKDRTHPTMSGSATGGFILRGIKVQPWKE